MPLNSARKQNLKWLIKYECELGILGGSYFKHSAGG